MLLLLPLLMLLLLMMILEWGKGLHELERTIPLLEPPPEGWRN